MSRPRTSLVMRGQMIILQEEGYSCQQIAKRLGCSKRTVENILRKSKVRGHLKDLKASGRPKLTSLAIDDIIVNKCKADRFKSAPLIAAEMCKEHGLNLSSSTIGRRLRKAGLLARKPRHKPWLTAELKNARLRFAIQHRHWNVEQWSKVLFTDESRFTPFKSDGRIYVRRMTGEEFNDNCILPTIKCERTSITVWGCFSRSGVGLLQRISNDMNAQNYVNMLANALIPSKHLLQLPEDWIFQQDNATIHAAKITKAWLSENNISVMKWPAQSPDLNPIENLWDIVSKRARKQLPRNNDDLWEKIKKEWDSIEPNMLEKLIDSMPRRCAKVIEAQGGNTKY